MVLESLITAPTAEKKPWDLFFIGFLYASVAMFLSVWVFREEASLVMILLTVIACLPLVHKTFKLEEEKDTKITKERTLLKEHGKAITFFMFMFMGFVFAFAIWYVFLPDNIVATVFATQIKTIKSINMQIAGVGVSGNSAVDSAVSGAGGIFMQILSNNIKVLLFCIFFAFFYGAGAIFILAWNASVISAAVGNFIRENISAYAAASGLTNVAGYFHVFSLGLLKYSIHGIPEILAYFIGGLAGGIISVAVIRHDFNTDSFKRILTDAFDLILVAVFVLLVAAWIEVYITPALF
ncbi:stage II sporulation protein M [Candidatus Woesearchaeota archaeon]|nr:stage II sporulation protein M [Candidatus Woesearchaeota archaeon]